VVVGTFIPTVAPRSGVTVGAAVLVPENIIATPITQQSVATAATPSPINLMRLFGFFAGGFTTCWIGLIGDCRSRPQYRQTIASY